MKKKGNIKKYCLICKTVFYTVESRIKIGKGKYCSKVCFRSVPVSEKTRKIWSEQRKGKHNSPKTEFKKGDLLNENNPKWKGNRVGYHALHTWLARNFGKAKECEFCGKTKKVQWANKHANYTRDINEWMQLCFWCHRKYDSKYQWGEASRQFPELRRKYA